LKGCHYQSEKAKLQVTRRPNLHTKCKTDISAHSLWWKRPGNHGYLTLLSDMLASWPSDNNRRIIKWMSSSSVIITDTSATVVRPSTAGIAPTVSVSKPKKIGDTYLAARPWVWITIELHCDRKPKRICRFCISRNTSGQQWKRDSNISHRTHNNPPARNYLSNLQSTQSGIISEPPSKNKTQSSGQTSTKANYHTSGRSLPLRLSIRNGWTYEPNNEVQNSSQQRGTTPYEYGNSAMTHFIQTQMHKSNITNEKHLRGKKPDSDPAMQN
jgi:hypothetical protein